MERKHHYAYNKTREAFLSLNVSVIDGMRGSAWAALPGRELKANDGIWVSGVGGWQHTTCRGPCDRIYLDANLCVVSLVEGLSGPPASEIVEQGSSVLLLPVHTIFNSQTRTEDRILIGTIEEIGAILEGEELSASVPSMGGGKVERRVMRGLMKWLAGIFASRDRRRVERHPSPPVMAFYWDGGVPLPHAVPDISRTGLFVETEDRWSPNTLMRLTLQKKSDDPERPDQSITLQCRVVRAGEDGVGMVYMLADRADVHNPFGVGRLASRKDLNRFFDQIVSEFNANPEPEYPLLPFPELSQPADSIQSENAEFPQHHADDRTAHNGHVG